MNANFTVNEYVLIWYILFKASVSQELYDIKNRLWNTYRNEYNATYKDLKYILEDVKDFIPNNDIIYNIVFESNAYKEELKSVEKTRLELLKVWDKYKKETNNLYKNIIRKKIDNYNFFVVPKELNTIDIIDNSIILGLNLDKDAPYKFLLRLNKDIIEKNIKEYTTDKDIAVSILELALNHEYLTNISKSNAFTNINSLKKYLYPYWLMYLGVPKEELKIRMKRDNIYFDDTKYAYEKELHKMDIEEFIDFCIRNKRYIIRDKDKNKDIEII